MRKLFLITLCATGILMLNAQSIEMKASAGQTYAKFNTATILGHSVLECIYEYTVEDQELLETRRYFDILQIGQSISKYYAYPKFQVDSVIYSIDTSTITTQQAYKIFSTYGVGNASDFLIIKNNDYTMQIDGRVFTDRYTFDDKVSFSWTLEDEVRDICGYSCQKATTSFRGKKWTVFFTSDIPKANGPWKFMGLPGLILQAEDENNEHTFRAIAIRNGKNPIYKENNRTIKTTREKFNKLESTYKNNTNDVTSGSQYAAKDLNGTEMAAYRKLFYNPLEIE